MFHSVDSMDGAGARDDLSPLHKAAILLLAMGQDEAAKVLEHLEPREVQRVGAALSALGGVDTGHVDAVVNHFLEAVSGEPGPTLGANDYLKRLLVGAVIERRVPWRRRTPARGPLRAERYRWTTPRAIAASLAGEPAQLQAMVLAYLRPARAARVLQALPLPVRVEVLLQLARLDMPLPDALAAVSPLQQAGRRLAERAGVSDRRPAGAVFALLDDAAREPLMAALRERDPALAAGLAAALVASVERKASDPA